MKKITEADRGKLYLLDNSKNTQVRLFEVLEDGFVRVVFPDGNHASVAVGRLSESPDEVFLESLLELERVEDTNVLDYPKKAVKVTIEIFDAEQGETTVKWLEDEDAVKWNDWMRELCFKAEEVGMNPPWLKLNWKTK